MARTTDLVMGRESRPFFIAGFQKFIETVRDDCILSSRSLSDLPNVNLIRWFSVQLLSEGFYHEQPIHNHRA